MTQPVIRPPLTRERNLILAALLTLAALGWAVFLREAGGESPAGMGDGMGAGMGAAMAGPDLSMGGSTALFMSMWVGMMAAMMFPAAAPMILMYARSQRRRPLNTSLFTGSYLALWVAFGVVAFLLAVGTEELVERSAFVADHWGRAGGALIVLAGVYQLTPLKDMCLRSCRSPLSFIMTSWRDGPGGAVRMGLRHGLYCAGCCWLIFLALVPLGLMNVAAMLLVAILVFAEKALPWGRGAARLAAVVLVIYGAAVMLRPELLPTVA